MKRLYFFLFLLVFHIQAQELPSSINNLVIWYSADSVQKDINNLVSILYDKSGNGFNAIQSTTSAKPQQTVGLNNLPTLHFDGNDYLTSTFNTDFNSPNTFFIVCNDESTSGGTNRFFFSGLSITQRYALAHGSNGSMLVFSGSSNISSYLKPFPFDYSYFTIQYKNNSVILRENGIKKDEKNITNGIFQGIKIGASHTNANAIIGNISEIIVYNRELDSTEIDGIELYIRHKYAPPINLGPDITYSLCKDTLKGKNYLRSFLWSDGTTNDSLVIEHPGSYWLEGTDVFGYTSRDTINYLTHINTHPSTVICQNSSTTWQVSNEDNYTYNWSDGSHGKSLTISQPGDYFVTITDTNGCSYTTDTITFTEDSYPSVASLGSDTSICSGSSIGLIDGATETVDYLWSTLDSTSSINIDSSGAYSLIATNINGCKLYDTINVAIHGYTPNITILTPDEVCVNENFTYQNTSTPLDTSQINYFEWDFGDSIKSFTPTGNFYYSTADTFQISLKVGTSVGCFSSTSKSIIINPNPIISILTSSKNCFGDSVNFKAESNSIFPISNWSWVFGDTASNDNSSINQLTSHVYTNTGEYTVLLDATDMNGCSTTVTKNISNLPQSDWFCLQTPPNQINELITWYNGENVDIDINGKIPTLYDLSDNTFNLEQITTNKRPKYDLGLNDLPTIVYSGNEYLDYQFDQALTPPFTFIMLSNDEGKTSNHMMFSGFNSQGNYSLFHNPSNTNLYIQVGSTNTILYQKSDPLDYTIHTITCSNDSVLVFENGTHKITKPIQQGSLNGLRLGAASNKGNGFVGDISEFILYNKALDSAEISQLTFYFKNKYAPPINLGSDITYSLCKDTLKGKNYLRSFLWSDGTTSDSLVLEHPGSYWLEGTDVFGFTSRDTINYLTHINIHPSTVICQNSSTTWQVSNEDNYTYDWSDGSHGKSLTISQPGNYFVTITDTNGCSYTTPSFNFIVDSLPSIKVLGEDKELCLGNRLTLIDNLQDIISYQWNTSDTSSFIVPLNTNDYSVIATNINGCIAKDTVNITILGEAPIADFNIDLSTCTNAFVTYQDISTINDTSSIASWEWDFGDGNTSTSSQGIHQFDSSGNFQVLLKVTSSNGCQQTVEKTVTAFNPPQVNFTSQFNCQGDAIKFNATQITAEFITDWNWIFDDINSPDNTSNGQNVQHIFADYGNHNVQLISQDINGCSDTVIIIKNILPQPIVQFSFEEGCEKSDIQFTNQSIMPDSSSIQSYIWDLGNGFGSQLSNVHTTYNNAGIYNVNLKATALNGCKNDTTIQLTIHSLPIINHFIEQDCAGTPTFFSDNSKAGDDSISNVNWQFNDGDILQGKGEKFQVVQTFNQEGNVVIKQIVTTNFGCIDSTNYNISILNYLHADFIISPTSIIADVPIEIKNTSIGDSWHQFTTEIGSTNQNDTSFIFSSDWLDSTISIQLIVRNKKGCADTIIKSFEVFNRSTDLAITDIISQDFDGFLKIGVELKNNGSTPISKALLKLERVYDNPIKEEWNGLLLAGESEVYVFHTMPLTNVPNKDTANNFICISADLLEPNQFTDEDLSNNQFCVTLSTTEMAIIETYPNPVKDELTIRIITKDEMNATVTIYDEGGKKTQSVLNNQSLEKGLNTFIVDTKNWTKGIYLMKVNERVIKFVKG